LQEATGIHCGWVYPVAKNCTTKSHSSTAANITLVGLNQKHLARPYQRSHASVDGSELYCYC